MNLNDKSDRIDNRRRRNKALVITLIFLILFNFYHFIDKYIGGVPFIIITICIPALFIWIIVNIVKGLITIIKSRKNLTLSICLPTILYIVVPLLPFPDSERLESKVLLRGCYEGTQNQAYVLFRQDHTFEIHSTGVFFYNKWYKGRWALRRDTILLNYKGDTSKVFGNKVIMRNGNFNSVNVSKTEVVIKPIHWYVGYCKGEN